MHKPTEETAKDFERKKNLNSENGMNIVSTHKDLNRIPFIDKETKIWIGRQAGGRQAGR